MEKEFKSEYRVVKIGLAENFEIVEVYYDGSGKAWGTSANGIVPRGENIEDLRSNVNKILSAFEKPTLDLLDIPEDGAVVPEWVKEAGNFVELDLG